MTTKLPTTPSTMLLYSGEEDMMFHSSVYIRSVTPLGTKPVDTRSSQNVDIKMAENTPDQL